MPAEQLDSVREALSKEHQAEVFLAEARPLPAHAFTTMRTPRYRADTLIAWLRTLKPDTADLIIGVTMKDISITKYGMLGSIKEPASRYQDFGIYGLGYIGGPSCVVSTFRLGDGPRQFERLAKITVHEVGHTRGLPHCDDPTCVMRDAVEKMSTVDGAGRTLCAVCRERVRGN